MAPNIIGVFSVLAALIAGAASFTLLVPGTSLDVIWRIRAPEIHAQMLALGWLVGAGLALVGVVALVTAIGSFGRRRWAWWLAAITLAVNAVSDVGRLFMGDVLEGVIGVVIAGAILFWLTRPGVRGQFSR